MRCLPLLLAFLVGCPTPPSDVKPADPTATPPVGGPGPGPAEATTAPAAPTDPNAPPADPNAAPADPNAPPADPNAPPPDPNAPPPAAGGPASAAGPGGQVDLALNVAQKSQEAIKGGAHVTLAGTIDGTCKGKVQLIVIDQSPTEPGAALPTGPVAVVDNLSVGAFSVAVPKPAYPRVGAFCDNNGDRMMDASAGDSATNQVDLGKVEADQSGIVLTLMGG